MNKYNLTIQESLCNVHVKQVSRSDHMHISYKEFSHYLQLDIKEVRNRIENALGKDPILAVIGVKKNLPATKKGNWLFDGYPHDIKYNWEDFTRLFPEIKDVDWDKIFNDYRMDLVKWGGPGSKRGEYLHIFPAKDIQNYISGKCHPDELCFHITWESMLEKFELTPDDVLKMVKFKQSYKPLRSSFGEKIDGNINFINDVRVIVTPNYPSLSESCLCDCKHDKNWAVTSWSEFLTLFHEANLYHWWCNGFPGDDYVKEFINGHAIYHKQHQNLCNIKGGIFK
jgi:hypothetical protein